MRRKRFNRDFEEVDRSSRVKMHKSGKNWVKTVMSQLALLRLMGGKSNESVVMNSVDSEELMTTNSGYLKGLLAGGALVGGGLLTSSQVLAAEETNTATESTVDNTEALVNTESASLADDTNAAATTETTAAPESVDTAEQVSLSESTSQSLLESASTSESVSTSESLSVSLSLNQAASSDSVSASVAQSQSLSASSSESDSMSASESESLANTAKTRRTREVTSAGTTDSGEVTSYTDAFSRVWESVDTVAAYNDNIETTPYRNAQVSRTTIRNSAGQLETNWVVTFLPDSKIYNNDYSGTPVNTSLVLALTKDLQLVGGINYVGRNTISGDSAEVTGTSFEDLSSKLLGDNFRLYNNVYGADDDLNATTETAFADNGGAYRGRDQTGIYGRATYFAKPETRFQKRGQGAFSGNSNSSTVDYGGTYDPYQFTRTFGLKTSSTATHTLTFTTVQTQDAEVGGAERGFSGLLTSVAR